MAKSLIAEAPPQRSMSQVDCQPPKLECCVPGWLLWRSAMTLARSALSAAASGRSEITTGVENSGTISEVMAPVYTRNLESCWSRCVERPARPRLEVERVSLAQPQPLDAGPGDHGAVVGAEFHRRGDKVRTVLAGDVFKAAAQIKIGRNAAGHDQGGRWRSAQCVGATIGQHVADGALEGGAEIGARALVVRIELFDGQAHSGLEAGEGEVAAGLAPHRPRQGEALRITVLGQPLHRWAAGKAQAQKLGGLVEA